MSQKQMAELKFCLKKCLFAYILIAGPLIFYSSQLYSLFAKPIIQRLPKASYLIAHDLSSTFMVPLKLSLISALLLALPYMLVQCWCFIAPALYKHEIKPLKYFALASVILFYSGICFAYAVVSPMAIAFFSYFTPENVVLMPSIAHYLNFVLSLSLSFGACFQTPIIITFLVYKKFCSIADLKAKRPYIIVACFIVGMLLTPPDIGSQILLALPLWALFEASLLIAKQFTNHHSGGAD